ncbi:hypothetical protein ACOSQ3_026284 [Xanthoceras sorbifolium]
MCDLVACLDANLGHEPMRLRYHRMLLCDGFGIVICNHEGAVMVASAQRIETVYSPLIAKGNGHHARPKPGLGHGSFACFIRVRCKSSGVLYKYW